MSTTLELVSSNRCHNGEQRYYRHASKQTQTNMVFSIYLPAKALVSEVDEEDANVASQPPLPAIIYLSGLTCTPDNVTHKGHFQQIASELNAIVIAPDTSPRGNDIADGESYDLGQGASFYVDATQMPWQPNYQMESYIIKELIPLLQQHFPIQSFGIMGHSMGGHGALVMAFKYPELFASVSAIAPICAPMSSDWGQKAFREYLGTDHKAWEAYDSCELIRQYQSDTPLYPTVVVDQGSADEFYISRELQPDKLHEACKDSGQPLQLNYHEGYDHSYYFIQTVLPEHIRHHVKAARRNASSTSI